MKPKVNKQRTNHGIGKGVPFNMPNRTGVGSEKMGSMGMGYKKGGKVSKFAKEEAAESPAFEAKEQKALKAMGMKKGGKVKKYARGGGIEQRGKTRGRVL